jgi:hypothetical protein
MKSVGLTDGESASEAPVSAEGGFAMRPMAGDDGSVIAKRR